MAAIATFTRSFLDLYYRLLRIALTLLIAIMLVPVSLQIVSRYTDIVARYIWTEEVARFCFVWIVMIGSMIAVRDGSHFKVELLPQPRSLRSQAVANLLVHVPMLFLALVFVWYGSQFASFGFIQKSEMSGINMLSIYISFPMAGATWTLFLLEKIVHDVRLISREGRSAAP